MLGDLRGATVVDAFAGSGALGLEALSRGAARATFCDPYRMAIQAIEDNIASLSMEDQSRVMKGEFLSLLSRIDGTPDLWFLDPPYDSGEGPRALVTLDESPKVTDGALIVWESGEGEDAPALTRLEMVRHKDYGSTWIRFFRCIEDLKEEGAG